MLNEVISLFYLFHDNKETIDHCARIARKALSLGYEEEIIAACYLHESLQTHYDEYYEYLQRIKAIDELVAVIVDKVTKKEKETWNQYYYRIYLVPEASKVVLLDMLDTLADCDEETFHRITDNLWRIYKGAYKSI